MAYQILQDLAVIVGLPVLRSAAGWAVKALEDNKITKFEVKLLASTVVRVGAVGLVGYLGLNGLGFDVSAISVAVGAYLFDMVYGKFDKK